MYMKERLAAGDCLIGAGIWSNSPDILECAAGGMDWIWWECQHTHVDWQATLHGVRTAFGMKIPVLLRTWTHDGGTIERLLDTGAEGIIVPMVDTAEQAQEIISHCYFPPLGNRSYGSIRMVKAEEDLHKWNKRIVTVMMVETPQAIANAEAIAKVPGVDALLVGSADLAMRLGKTPTVHTSHADCKDELEHVVRVCRNTGKAPAVLSPPSVDGLKARLREGFRLICAGMDVNHVDEAYKQMKGVFTRITSKKEFTSD